MAKAVPKSTKISCQFHLCGSCRKAFFTSSELTRHACSQSLGKPLMLSPRTPLLPKCSNMDITTGVTDQCNDDIVRSHQIAEVPVDNHHVPDENVTLISPTQGPHQDMVSPRSIENCRVFHLCSLCGKGFSTFLALMEHACGCPEDQLGPSPADEVSQKPTLESQMDLNVGEVPIIRGKGFGQESVLKMCTSSITGVNSVPYGRTNIFSQKHQESRVHSSQVKMSRIKQSASCKSLGKMTKVGSDKKKHMCPQCRKQFLSASDLKVHFVIHTGEKPYKCPTCNKGFSQKTSRQQHMYIHTKEWPHVCPQCNTGCPSRSALKAHMNIHTGEKDHVCQLCGKQFMKASHLKDHFLTHTGEKPHKCDECGKEFKQLSHLKKHTKSHTKKKHLSIKKRPDMNPAIELKDDVCFETVEHQSTPLIGIKDAVQFNPQGNISNSKETDCSSKWSSCNEDLESIYQLENHTCSQTSEALTNIKEKPTLNFLGKKDTNWQVQLDMMQKQRKTAVPYQLQCTDFEKNLDSGSGIDNHASNQEPYQRPCSKTYSSRKVHPCSQCGKLFSSKAELKRHKYIHTGEKPHVCNICGQGFTQGGTLKSHQYTHTGDWPCVCMVCGKGFSNVTALKIHMRIHTGLKPHTCDVCSTGFSRASHLKAHMYTHTDSKPHACNVCGKGFTHVPHLKRHLKVHTRESQLKNSKKNKSDHVACMRGTLKGEIVFERCEICIWGFIDGEELVNHLSDSHM